MKKLRAMKDKRGFTLIELIIVIAILAILAAIAIPAMAGYVGQSEQAVADANARTVYGAASSATAKYAATVVTTKKVTELGTGNTFEGQLRILLGEDFKGTISIAISPLTATWTEGTKTATYPK